MKITLLRKLEELKSGQWWEWDCEIEMQDGSIRFGTVQSDGHMIAEETLAMDP